MPSATAPDDTNTTSTPRWRSARDISGPAGDRAAVNSRTAIGHQCATDFGDDAAGGFENFKEDMTQSGTTRISCRQAPPDVRRWHAPALACRRR